MVAHQSHTERLLPTDGVVRPLPALAGQIPLGDIRSSFRRVHGGRSARTHGRASRRDVRPGHPVLGLSLGVYGQNRPDDRGHGAWFGPAIASFRFASLSLPSRSASSVSSSGSASPSSVRALCVRAARVGLDHRCRTRGAFNPLAQWPGEPLKAYGFLTIRFVGLVLVVPVMEEFFLRSWSCVTSSLRVVESAVWHA